MSPGRGFRLIRCPLEILRMQSGSCLPSCSACSFSMQAKPLRCCCCESIVQIKESYKHLVVWRWHVTKDAIRGLHNILQEHAQQGMPVTTLLNVQQRSNSWREGHCATDDLDAHDTLRFGASGQCCHGLACAASCA